MTSSSSNFQLSDLVDQGATLAEKAVDVHVIDGTEYIARWYYSPHDADLMIWFDAEQQIDRYQLNSGGQIVDWSRSEGLKTGFIVEIELAMDGKTSKAASGEVAETIQFDLAMNGPAVTRAKTIVENCTAFTAVSRLVILDSLQATAASVSNSGPTCVSSSRARFWGRFKRWTTGA